MIVYIILGLVALSLIIGFLIIMFLSKSKIQFDKEMIPIGVFSGIIAILVIILLGFFIIIATVPKSHLTAKTKIENVKFGTKTTDVNNSTFYLVENKSNHKLKPAWDIKNDYITTSKTELNFKRLDKNKNDSLLLDDMNSLIEHNKDKDNVKMKTTTKDSYIVMHYQGYNKQSWVYKLFHIKNETDIQRYDVYLNPKDIQMTKNKVNDLNKEIKDEIRHERHRSNNYEDEDNAAPSEIDKEEHEDAIDKFEQEFKDNQSNYKPFIKTKGAK